MDSSATLHELRTVPLAETLQKSSEQQCQQVRLFSLTILEVYYQWRLLTGKDGIFVYTSAKAIVLLQVAT